MAGGFSPPSSARPRPGGSAYPFLSPRWPSHTGLPEAMPSITVVLTTFSERRWPQLQLAVRSLHGQTQVPDEIVIVVDHNPALLRTVRHTFPEITVIENREPAGLSGARNTGLTAATGAIVAFIDHDADASPHCPEPLPARHSD